MKSAGTAVILSFFLPGLGSLYTEAYASGLVLLFFWALALILAVVTFGVGPLMVWAVGMVLAHNQAVHYNKVHGESKKD